VPSSVRFGGRHRLVVHKLSDGRRIVESLGPDDGEITFQGTFSGANAEARIRAFNSLRLSGDAVWLVWESFRRLVVVKNLIADYHSPWWIPYRISCIVVDQEGTDTNLTSSLWVMISSDLGQATSAAYGQSISLDSLQATLATSNVLTAGTSNHGRAVSALEATLASVRVQIHQSSAGLAAPVGTAVNISAFTNRVNCAGSLAAAVAVSAYVGRIGKSLTGQGV
jgi:hypothetical protein